MGPASDALAVVDPSLRVHGLTGIRIADASILPSLVSGQLNATVTMVAERAAEMVLADLKDERLDGTLPDARSASPDIGKHDAAAMTTGARSTTLH